MKNWLLLSPASRTLSHWLLAGLCVLSTHSLAQDLAPPDVDFYLELHKLQTDYKDFSGEDGQGFRFVWGMELNETKWFGWNVAVEGAISRMGQALEEDINVRAPNSFELSNQPTLTQVATFTDETVEMNTLQGGVKLSEGENLFVRAGVELHDFKTRTDRLVIQSFNNLPKQYLFPADLTDSESKLLPYLGVGLQIPITRTVRLVGDYTAYRVNGELIGSVGLGLHMRFGDGDAAATP